MAVPKRKTSPSKRNMRRSHDSIGDLNIIADKESGEPRYPTKLIYQPASIMVDKF